MLDNAYKFFTHFESTYIQHALKVNGVGIRKWVIDVISTLFVKIKESLDRKFVIDDLSSESAVY